MDADGNGIPCETVYPAQDVRAHYGEAAQQPTPQGTLRILGPLHGDYGQGFSRWRECSTWTLGFVNDSDTTVSKVVFDPPSAAYTGPWDPSKQEFSRVSAEPRLEVLAVSLAPGTGRDITFQTCTPTAPPPDSDYSFSVRTPESITFHWTNGATGTTQIM